MVLTLPTRKKVALVAHDNKKKDLMEWAEFNRGTLSRHELCATGTTGKVLSQRLDLEVTKLQSGPLGGDQQIGAMISKGEIDVLIFFWDPLEPQPHDPDVKALLRMAVMIASPLMGGTYRPQVPDYDSYSARAVDAS
jgi:methylglyoxal synthase